MRALRESEATARAAERELSELRVENSALLKKCGKIMSILKSEDEDEEVETEELEQDSPALTDVPLVVRIESEKSNSNDGTSPASAICISSDDSDVSLAGSFARVSLKSPSSPATSEEDDSEDDGTSPVFMREMAKQHKICSDNFFDRAKSAEKRGRRGRGRKGEIF